MQVTYKDHGTPVWRITLAPSGEDSGSALIDPAGVAQLEQILQAAETSDSCRVLVLTGSAGRFCLGMDLAAAATQAELDLNTEIHRFANCLRLLRTSPKVVVSAVDGAAMGGGLGLAAAADIAIATEDATFGLPELVLGLLPAVVLPVILERLTPQKARLLALASSIDAQRALDLGLIDRVVSDQDTLERAIKWAIKHALRCKPEAVSGFKSLGERIKELPLAGALHAGTAETTKLLQSADTVDAIKAFLEGEPLPWFDRYRPEKE